MCIDSIYGVSEADEVAATLAGQIPKDMDHARDIVRAAMGQDETVTVVDEVAMSLWNKTRPR